MSINFRTVLERWRDLADTGLLCPENPAETDWGAVVAAIAATRATLAQPEGEGPSLAQIDEKELLRAYCDARRAYCHDGPEHIDWQRDAERGATLAGLGAVLARWGHPAAHAQPEGEGSSERIVSIAKAVQDCAFSWEPGARMIGNVCAEDVADLCSAVLARWGHPAAHAQPEGEAPHDLIRKLLHSAYEPGDGSADGAQQVSLVWWRPVYGSDSLQIVIDNARDLLTRWGRPAATPAPEQHVSEPYKLSAPEMQKVMTILTVGSSCGAGALLSRDECRRAATLLQHKQAAPAPAVVPVAVSERLPTMEAGDFDREGR